MEFLPRAWPSEALHPSVAYSFAHPTGVPVVFLGCESLQEDLGLRLLVEDEGP